MIKVIDNIKGEWSRELNIEFIFDYQKLKVIWDPSMRHLKSDRVQAVRSLCQKYKLSPDEVRGRIKVLRTSFHREHIKVLKSANSNEPYTPKWYGYELMRFIVDDISKDHLKKIKNEIDDSFHISDATIFDINFLNYEQLKQKEKEEQNNTINHNGKNDLPDSIEVLNINDEMKKNNFRTPGQCDTIETNLVKSISDKPEEITIRCDNVLFNNSKDALDLNNESLDLPINQSTPPEVDGDSNIERPPPCKRTKYCIPNIWDKDYSNHSFCHYHCNNNHKNERDEFIVFGENVAVTLKNLKSSKSKIIAKHMINNILFEAQMGKYDQ